MKNPRGTTAALAAIILFLAFNGTSKKAFTESIREVEQCGWIVEESEIIPASCITERELSGRISSIKAERSGTRDWLSCEVAAQFPSGPEPEVTVWLELTVCSDGSYSLTELP